MTLNRLGFVSIILLILTSCSPSNAPESHVELAISGVHSGKISDNGEYAVIGSVLHGGSLWQLTQLERLYNWNHQAQQDERSILISVDIEPSNKWALTAEAHTMVLWDIKTGEAARFWSSPGEVLDADLAENGRYALLGLADHSAVIFDILKGGILRTFTHQGRVRSVDLSQDGQLAITGSEDQTAVVWQVNSGEKLITIQHQEDVQLVAISPDGRFAFTTAKYDRAEIWDITTRTALKSLPLSKEKLKRGLQITAARFSKDGSQLLLGYTNQQVELWDVATTQLINRWKLTKRHLWQPTGVAVVDLAFTF